MDNQSYRTELKIINETILANKFQLFLSVRDLREQSKYKAFRTTSPDDSGYVNREKVIRDLLKCFRRAYRIRGKEFDKKIFWYCLHESGVGREHWLVDDRAHCHLLIGFTDDCTYHSQPDLYLSDFIALIKGGFAPIRRIVYKPSSLRWIDFCCSLGDQKDNCVIRNIGGVATYLSKPELGTINGGCFSKRPFYSKNIILPQQPCELLEPLGLL